MDARKSKRAHGPGALVGLLAVGLALGMLGARWQARQDARLARRALGSPDVLVNFGEFARLAGAPAAGGGPLELSRRSLLFVSNLVTVAQHNLWSLALDPASKQAVYYLTQTLAGAHLTRAEQSALWRDGDNQGALVEMLAADGAERPVSEPGAKLEKTSGLGLGRWFKRMTDPDYFDIPNFPLDRQPDPARVTHVDADLRDCTDVIKNQKSCGACYAFSFVSLAEWHLCRLTDGNVKDLSEQYIVDCGHKTKLRGCREGLLSNVRKFSQFFGMKYERDQKYDAREHTCTNDMMNRDTLKVKVVDWKRIKVERESFEKILEEQPILLEVHLPSDFNSYSRGVHPGHNCNERLGHGMLLVGYGRQDGVPYWLLRNSMGKSWGENGYLRLSRDMPNMQKCFANGFVGKFKFAHVDEAKYTELYDSMKYQPEEAVAPEEKGELNDWLKI